MLQQETINELVEKAIRTLAFPEEPRRLYEPVGYMFSIGGKHLRPRLCLTAYNLFHDAIPQEAVYPAIALETFHSFTLIHDDIMDRSDTRRGRPTVHVKWDDNTAILSGDLMSILAYRYLAMGPADKLPALLRLFTDTAVGVCEGQQLDMDFERKPFITMDDYLRMIGLKTGVLLAAAVAMGGILAGAPEAQCKALYDYGYHTGLAFQITDDYLDCFGDARTFGKPIGGDIAENKKSWLLVEALRRAISEADKKRIAEIMALGDDRRAEKIAAMTQLYIDLGVRDAADSAILECHNRAIEALERAGFTAEQVGCLKELAEKLLHREK
jgi:geranylgeranyl diphosphate synthase type II